MAKLRTNHNKSNNAGSTLMRYIVFAIGLMLVLWVLYNSMDSLISNHNDGEIQEEDYAVPISTSESDRYYLPKGSKGEVVHHKYYSLSYAEKHEQAEWVAYELTKASLKKPNVKRAKRFKPDYDVSSRSAFHRDYSHSGYTRGHMAPAGDMAFDKEAMQESFFMSNMSPQTRSFNNGIWKELEETVRDWAYDNNRVYIVTGPMLNQPYIKRIGKSNKISVPAAFYKVILDIDKPDRKGIAFIIPHETSDRPLSDYAVSIDELEAQLGFDLFADLISPELQDKIESSYNIKDWKFSKKRYNARVNKWNHQ